MLQPLLKRFASHFFEFHIESASTPYNSHMYVSFKRGRYQLCTADAVYSYGDLYDNFFKAFAEIDLDKQEIENVLLLGLGLGSIPYMLERNFKKSYHYTAVEIDEVVAYLANKYVLKDLDSKLEIFCADAGAFVKQYKGKFDMICMDVFQNATIPPEFEEREFLIDLKNLLRDDGLMLYNRLTRTKKDSEATSLYYHNIFVEVFPEATYLDVTGNWILVNCGN